MKLAMIRRIAHHTSGDANPLTPVHENPLSGSATSVAPRFKKSSETNTQAMLNPSCSHGLPKPDGRFCIRFCSAHLSARNKFRCGRDAALRRPVGAAHQLYQTLLKARARSETSAKLDRAESARGI